MGAVGQLHYSIAFTWLKNLPHGAEPSLKLCFLPHKGIPKEFITLFIRGHNLFVF
jgi:hypothetical protein